jgi:hypothetical protein
MTVCHGGANNLKLCTAAGASSCPSGTCTSEVPRGYGVRLSTMEAGNAVAILFADANNDRTFNTGEEIKTRKLSPSSRVTVTAVSPVSAGRLDIVFEPPKPTVQFNGSTATTVASVVITHAVSGASRTVTMNRVSGQVSID